MKAGLPALLLLSVLLAVAGTVRATVAWVVDPSDPGPDIPAAGESRFDQLFRNADGSYAIPYPVDALIEFLEARLDNGKRSGIRRILIPMGRSLQREAAAPDYFKFPRLVIATEGEPAGDAAEAGLVMEYRLFIAHQPKTGSLEIVSYNDAAGRFEFQVIEGYDGGGKQQSRAVSRAMCMSCHHNGAPIFARNPWSETSFNLDVARRLAEALPDRYPSAIEILTVDADVIDVLTERANYLSAAQLLWRRGCVSRTCRAAILRAILQYRLSGKSDFDRGDSAYREFYIDELRRNWERYWPAGLSLPGSRIPDRDPFSAPVGGELDALSPRPPQASWSEADSVLADGIVTRLGGFLTRFDLQRLDGRLQDLARERGLQPRHYRSDCKPAHRDRGIVVLDCVADSDPGMRARIEIENDDGQITGLGVVALKLPGSQNLLQPETVVSESMEKRISVSLRARTGGLSERLYSGERVSDMRFEWDDSWSTAVSRLEVRVVDDFRFLDAALRRLTNNPPATAVDPLGAAVFRRDAVFQALAGELGMPGDSGLRNASADRAERRKTVDLKGGLALLEPYCAACHADRSRHPPGFLSASAERGGLSACAPRMLARLRAWKSQQASDPVPMPPPVSIGLIGGDAATWPNSEHYSSLVANLEKLLEQRFGSDSAAHFRDSGYAQLPPCRVNISE